ncbi:hypothetical protein Taro_039796 [Colocasia esculenta]|uniref:DNA-3-methyladenine glycosylase I n=1 Tax=Colocasia esculenta TaxID=4460 RepID=A0A843W7B9_COLES|nr:hypothetical protein [Colocasia esculenta]
MWQSEARPVLGPAGNKARSVATTRKPASKPSRKVERAEVTSKDGKKSPNSAADSPPLSPSLSAPSISRRQELLLQSNLSLNASCSSDCSTDSYCSRASTGRIGGLRLTSRRKHVLPKSEKIVAKLEKLVPDDTSMSSPEYFYGKRRCAWVTPNIDPCYAVFHDEEWGIPVHDDKKLFELLVLSGALAELTWPVILSKRHIFRDVFMDFDPVAVAQMSNKKIIAPSSAASSLLSEPKLRAITENARQMLKIIEEFGSFDRYCWRFVNHKPIVNRYRYPRHVPVKTPKADTISKDLVKRGFRCVGPTVIYSFMQVAGITNDHLTNCYRFDECCAAAAGGAPEKEANCLANHNVEEKSTIISNALTKELDMGIDLGLDRGMNRLAVS